MPKTLTDRWNLEELGYFDPHLDQAYRKIEVVLIGKEIYYKKVVLFVQYIESFVIFQRAALVKAIMATFFFGSI